MDATGSLALPDALLGAGRGGRESFPRRRAAAAYRAAGRAASGASSSARLYVLVVLQRRVAAAGRVRPPDAARPLRRRPPGRRARRLSGDSCRCAPRPDRSRGASGSSPRPALHAVRSRSADVAPAQQAAALLDRGRGSHGLRASTTARPVSANAPPLTRCRQRRRAHRRAAGAGLVGACARSASAAAREQWERFAREALDDPRLPAGAAPLRRDGGAGGDEAGARAARPPPRPLSRPRPTEAATLNRAVLALRAGREADALRDLDTLTLARPALPLHRAHPVSRGRRAAPHRAGSRRGGGIPGRARRRGGRGAARARRVAFTRGQWVRPRGVAGRSRRWRRVPPPPRRNEAAGRGRLQPGGRWTSSAASPRRPGRPA